MFWSWEVLFPTLTNHGTLWNLADKSYVLSTFYLGSFYNHGLIVAQAIDSDAHTIDIRARFHGEMVNTGSIYALSYKSFATAVDDWGGGPLINSGLIAALSLWEEAGFGGARAVQRFNGGAIHNLATGQILAEGVAPWAIQFWRGHQMPPGFADYDDIVNEGLIEARALNPAYDSIGLELDSLEIETLAVVNSGTIRADIAIVANGEEEVVLLGGGGRKEIKNLAGGLIDGDILLDNFNESLDNHGRILGDIDTGGGSDRIANAGTIVGDIDLGGGSDLWLGLAGDLQGTVAGGDGADGLYGSLGADVLMGGAGADVIQGGGGDRLDGGADGDIFVYAAIGESTAAVFDTIVGFMSGVDRIDLSALAVQSASIQAGAGFTLLTAATAAGMLVVHIEGALAQSDLILSASPALAGTTGTDMLHATAGGSILTGDAGNDTLIGSSGKDRLDGGAGADTLLGGRGDDVYSLHDHADWVWEVAGQGHDTIEVYHLSNVRMPENVEDMVSRGPLAAHILGNALDNRMTGNAGTDEFNGAGGDDVLIGAGGVDYLSGASGSDSFVYLSATDSVSWAMDEIRDFESGIDRFNLAAVTPISVTWAEQSYYQNGPIYYVVTAVTGAGTMVFHIDGGIALTDFVLSETNGTESADTLTGTAGADDINGGGGDDMIVGGAGVDWMSGGQGNDTFFVDNIGDKVTDLSGEGYDVVAASLSWVLTAGAYVELMTTGWIEGTAAIDLAGNELGQQIWGNGAANILSGKDGDDTLFGFGGGDTLLGDGGNDVLFGGAGAIDDLFGGLGDDTYFADDSGDAIHENAGEGRDVAAASVDYALGAGTSIELMTTGFIGGTATLNFTGNQLGNEIWGNDGVNALHGGGGNVNDALLGFGGNDRLDGGAGLDLLVGGSGQDSFVFANTLVSAEADIIADFSSADDTILLDDAVFTGLSLGALNPGAFVTGTAALDADDRIIYDAATGKLWFDADGSGTGAAIQFAVLSGNPALNASDFLVF